MLFNYRIIMLFQERHIRQIMMTDLRMANHVQSTTKKPTDMGRGSASCLCVQNTDTVMVSTL